MERLDDLLLRRSLMAMLGEVTSELLRELAELSAEPLGWTDERKAAEIQRSVELLRDRHRVVL